MKLYETISNLQIIVICISAFALFSCSKPDIEEEVKPVTKGSISSISQITQSGGGIIYDLVASNGRLYIYANTTDRLRITWTNLPGEAPYYWTFSACGSGDAIDLYPGTLKIEASTSYYGNATPVYSDGYYPGKKNPPIALHKYNDETKAWETDYIYDSQPNPTNLPWAGSQFVSQWEIRMYEVR